MGLAVVAASVGRAQPAAPTAPTAPTAPAAAPATPAAAPTLATAKEALASTDAAQVERGLAELTVLAGPQIVAPIAARLRAGLPPPLALRAMDLLASSGHAASAPVLAEMLAHRRPAIRVGAVKALGALRARRAVPRIVALLDDPDEDVRAAAAEALGRCGDRRAVEPLFGALDRGVPGAAVALARLANAADAARLVAFAQDRSLSVVEPALWALLDRDDFPRDGKVRLFDRVGALGTHEAQAFLRKSLERLPEKDRTQMMRAVDRAMQTARRLELERAEAQKRAAP